MREYQKVITYAIVFVVVIVAIILLMTNDVNFFFFNNLSIASIDQVKQETDALIETKQKEEQNYLDSKETLTTSKNSFDVAKTEYENIDEATIKEVQEATKEEKYFIEYLWIVLGDYAKTNNVIIDIVTPGATVVEEEETTEEETASSNKKATTETNNEVAESQASVRDTILNNSTNKNTTTKDTDTEDVKGTTKLTVTGRYADVADFVFDVENDSSLKFKLDNIKMTYSKDNLIVASFDILSLSVSK